MSLARRFDQKGKVIILSETTDEPLTFAGLAAGVCWGADIKDNKKNFERGIDCFKSGHWRTLEFPQIYMILDGWSAKCIRELYTHIIDVTRLQASTRYINYDDFSYVTPTTIEKNESAKEIYTSFMTNVNETMKELKEIGIAKEDASEILPLSYSTKMMFRVGLRELINIMEQRLCQRAYWEIRDLCNEILDALCIYSDEWEYLIKELEIFVPKCKRLHYCPERYSCHREINLETLLRYIEEGKARDHKVVSEKKEG